MPLERGGKRRGDVRGWFYEVFQGCKGGFK